MSDFSKHELIRYNRQMMLPGMGIAGQQKLKNAKIVVIGAGGLGCPVLLYLANAGIGTLGIVDFDTVELHNLHRQILYKTTDVGKPKAEIAAQRLKDQNANISIQVHKEMLNEKNAAEIISAYDMVIDGSDNFQTRYLVNDTCVQFGKPLVYGSILRNEAQFAVFNYKLGKNLRDIYPEAPDAEDVPSCDEIGVMGTIPGLTGLYMAHAALEIVLGEYQQQELICFDFKRFSSMKMKL